MKKFLLPIFFLFSCIGFSQIVVDDTFTVQELVEDVLINSPCAQVSNFNSDTGSVNNGIGFFDGNGSSFPFQSGVVLSTGAATEAEGPNDQGGFQSEDTDAPADPDLDAAIPTTDARQDRTFIEFDFVPQISTISFNFLFASEEYEGSFQCTFTDAFAFLLFDPSGGVQNLAVLPGVPPPNNIVSVTNVHPDVPGSCGPMNEQFFGQYNDGANAPTSPIQFNGQTVVLTAQGNVIPGETYRIKLVIADDRDGVYDSAVFLEAGSFNIGVDLGPDATISNGNAPCEGEEFEIGLINPAPGESYRWFVFNPGTGMFDLIPGEFASTLTVTQNGTYQIEVTSITGCAATDDIVVEFAPQPTAAVPDPLEACDEAPNDGFTEFDLTLRDVQIQNGEPNTTVSYYVTEAEAEAGFNAILNPTTFQNSTINTQTVYARLEESNFGCYDVVPLFLIVNQSPEISDPISDYFICDNDQDGFEEFDLTSKDSEILGTLVNVDLTYHTSQADAEGGVGAIMPANMYVSGGETIWVRAVNYEGGNPSNPELCYTVGSFELVLGDIPVFTVVPEFEQCDNDGDGVELFDLNMQNMTITGGAVNLSVTYHPDMVTAEAGTMPLTIPYSSMGGETIWVRVEDNTTGCYGTFAMDLVLVMAPEIFQPDPLVYCDDDNDGFGVFTLTDADSQVVNGNPSGNLEVSYHLTQSDANNDVLALVSPYNNEDAFSQIVYVRLEDTATGCYSTTTLELIVRERPDISAPSPLVACDDDGDGITEFDLTLAEPEVLAGLDPALYTVTYYVDMALTNEILTPTAYQNISNPQTVYIVVAHDNPSDPDNDCVSQTELLLEVNTPPVLTDPAPLEQCDDDNDGFAVFNLNNSIIQITGGDPSIGITFYETLGDAQSGTNPITTPTAYQNTTPAAQTIYIRAEDGNTGCVTVDGMVTLDLIVNPIPVPNDPTPLVACDDDNDGIYSLFDLESKNDEITLNPDVTVTYHESMFDAENGIFALASPYENITANSQVLFVRVEYTNAPNDTGCFALTELELIVNPAPELPELEDLVQCDQDDTAVFDLTVQTPIIFDGQDPNFILTYHESQADAQGGTGAISQAQAQAYTNLSNPQTIWVRFEDDQTGCFDIGSFDLVVSLGPEVIDPTEFVKCDDLGQANDGFTSFDLTTKNGEITNNNTSVSVEYYLTQEDAQNAENRIEDETDFTNTENPQTLFVRVIGENGCVAFTTLKLVVNPNPTPETPTALEQCETGNDPQGQESFDLTQAAAEIIGNESGVTLSYHESYQDAVAGTPQILDPTDYENPTAGTSTVYVRMERTDTGCFEIVELVLIVNPLPDDTAVVSPYEICEVPFDGVAVFDLTSKAQEILGPDQDLEDYQVSFYLDATAAANGTPAIGGASTYQNTSNPQEIFTGIENIATGCYIGGVQSFFIEVKEGAVANTPATAYVICDNEGANDDGIGSFDLTSASDPQAIALRDEILGGQDPMDYDLSFHETLEAASEGTPSIGFPYVNVINPQVIYARVENIASGCFEIAEVILKVDPLPLVVLDEEYRLCLDGNGLVIMEEEGAPSPPLIDTGLDGSLYSFEWFIDGVLQTLETGPSIVAQVAGEYMVVVTNLDTGCQNTATTTVYISTPPLTFSAEVVSGAFANTHVIEATATGDGANEYVFQLDDGPFQESGTFEDVLPGTHLVTIKDANGCGSVTIEVSVIDYPRFVTPNQDGYHDTWNIIGIGDGDPTAKIYIFDRYGKLLKQISPTSQGWDGTYNGNPLPSSDYWFLVEYTEDDTRKEFRGHFTLKR